MFTRRQMLVGGAALGAAGLTAPRVGRAAEVAPTDRKFIFVFARGGWDTTKVFAPVFSSAVARDGSEVEASYGNLRLVGSDRRPLTDVFFQANHHRLTVLDGILIRSINHPICRNLWLTNSPNATQPDWPALIGYAAADRYVVPHMIVEGYSMAGDLAAFTAVSGQAGQLEGLLGTRWATNSDDPRLPFSPDTEEMVDLWLASRAARKDAQATTDVERRLTAAFDESASRLHEFKVASSDLALSGSSDFGTQILQATEFLSNGISRCVTLTLPMVWDTHMDNSSQSGNYEEMFTLLMGLNGALAHAPGTTGTTLADETVVVVFSEMGRTPFLNSSLGKDHWMYTSMMLWGPGVRGDIQVGAYDDTLNGRSLDLQSGEPTDAGVPLTPDVIGSTLLTLAGIDPGSILGSDNTLRAVLA
ncbi:MAG: DUF1501 domain-containing protein [Myxococcales bacterium]|nr:DUF1501 domain-containing protein [Myxococcales bacterium]